MNFLEKLLYISLSFNIQINARCTLKYFTILKMEYKKI